MTTDTLATVAEILGIDGPLATALNPQTQAVLDALADAGARPFEEMSVPEARDAAAGFLGLQGDQEPVATVSDIQIPGADGKLPARVYNPSGNADLPVIVYFHGGGWVFGNLEVVDRPCRLLARQTQCIVVAVSYRLSPETRFPGAPEDCYSAVTWVAENAAELGADATQLVVAGDSAGGNLAASVCLMANDRGGPHISYQVLFYPVTAPPAKLGSYADFREGYLLTQAGMNWFWDHYIQSAADSLNPYAAPLLAESVAELPPATIVTAGFDPLRDEGLAYAGRLHEAGVPVRVHHYSDMAHGFFWMPGAIDAGRQVTERISDDLTQHFSSDTN